MKGQRLDRHMSLNCIKLSSEHHSCNFSTIILIIKRREGELIREYQLLRLSVVFSSGRSRDIDLVFTLPTDFPDCNIWLM